MPAAPARELPALDRPPGARQDGPMSIAASAHSPPGIRAEAPAFAPGPFIVAAAIALGVWLLNASFGWRMASLFGVGAAAGVVLYHAAFGFTSAWRVFIADGRGEGLRAQMLMLAITCAAFFPLLGAGRGLRHPPERTRCSRWACRCWPGRSCSASACSSAAAAHRARSSPSAAATPGWSMTLFFFVVGSLLGTAHVALLVVAADLSAADLAGAAVRTGGGARA